MTGREFAKLARVHLMPYLPGFVLKNGIVYSLPVNRLWRRFHFQPSGFSREPFTIECAVSPLYVPDTVNAYPAGLADRLPHLAGRGDRWWVWEPDDEAAEDEMMSDLRALMLNVGVPFLQRFAEPSDVAQTLSKHPSLGEDPHMLEALAYSLILAGKADLAHDQLVALRRITLDDEERAAWWAENSHPRRPAREDWVITIGKRAESVALALSRSPAEAQAILDTWNEEQLAALRLPHHG